MKTQTCHFGMIMASCLGKMLDKAKNQGKPRRYLRNINVRWFGFDLSDVQEMRIADDEVERYSIKKGDLVVCEGGEPGRCAIWCDEDTVCFQKALHRVRFNEASDPRFYMYYLWMLAKSGALAEYYTGTGIKHLTGESLKKIPVPVPSLPEQKRIVAKIEELFSELDSGVETLKKTKQQLAVYRQAVLKAAFEGRYTEKWRKTHVNTIAESDLNNIRIHNTIYKDVSGDENEIILALPREWIKVRMGDVFVVEVGATPSRREPEYWNGDVAWVSSGEVRFNVIHKTLECITQSGLNNTSTNVQPIGTIMLAMIGEGKTRGQAAILNVPAAHNQNTAAILVSKTPCHPKYIYYFLQLNYENTRRVGSGNNQKALNKERVRALRFPFSSFEEQKLIVSNIESRFSVCDSIEKTVDAALQQAEVMRQSILKKAFEGNL